MSRDMEKLSSHDIEDMFALTPMQEGLLFHYLKYPDSDLYFEQLCLDITGPIDLHLFEQAWNLVIESNEMLRAVFRWEKLKRPLQVILKRGCLQFQFRDMQGKGKREREQWLEEIKRRDKEKKFDLRQIPFRITLCRLKTDAYKMIISNHHILYDGWSNGIILKEFLRIYNALYRHLKPDRPAKHKFKEFIQWTNHHNAAGQKEFWRGYLSGSGQAKANPIFPFGQAPVGEVGNFKFKFSRISGDRVNEFLSEEKITLAALAYGVWGILMRKYYHCDEVLFGTTVSGRRAGIRGIEDMVGLFINTLPFRLHLTAGDRVRDVLQKINVSLREREAYESTSLAEIKKWIGMAIHKNIFDTVVVVENYPLDAVLKDKESVLSLHSCSLFIQTHIDLLASITRFSSLEITFGYNKLIFGEQVLQEIGQHFELLMDKVLETSHNPGLKIGDMELVEEKQKSAILADIQRDMDNVSVEFNI